MFGTSDGDFRASSVITCFKSVNILKLEILRIQNSCSVFLTTDFVRIFQLVFKYKITCFLFHGKNILGAITI